MFEEDAAEPQPVTLRKGPYGYYVQLGEAAEGEQAAAAPRYRRAWTPPPSSWSGRWSSWRCRG